MQPEARQSRIEEYLQKVEFASLDELSEHVDASQSTVRRDLTILETKGTVRRTHGGARIVTPRSDEFTFSARDTHQLAEKQAIGLACAELIKPNQTVIIDAGTTVYHVARHLESKTPQIVTNSLPIANRFINDERIELILTGGLLYPRYGVLLGPTAVQFIETVHAQTLFFSVAGIHDGMLYNQNLLLVHAEQRMMRQAQRRVLLCDSSKFDQQALARLCELKDVDTLVTDDKITKSQRAMVKRAGCEVLVAE